jgi:putative transposase
VYRNTSVPDNGAEMTAKIVRSWLAKLGAKTLHIEPGSAWENGYCESLRDECLNGEIFYTLKEATVVIEQWRNHTTRSGRTYP